MSEGPEVRRVAARLNEALAGETILTLDAHHKKILESLKQEPAALIGRKIVIVANLAPRKLRGLESNGMLLAASLEGGKPVLAGFLEDVPLGARLK